MLLSYYVIYTNGTNFVFLSTTKFYILKKLTFYTTTTTTSRDRGLFVTSIFLLPFRIKI